MLKTLKEVESKKKGISGSKDLKRHQKKELGDFFLMGNNLILSVNLNFLYINLFFKLLFNFRCLRALQFVNGKKHHLHRMATKQPYSGKIIS